MIITIIVAFIGMLLVLMPAWILGVSEATISVFAKRVLMLAMAVVSILFVAYLLLKPTHDQSLFSRYFGGSVIVFYLIVVIAVVYHKWPK